jgi:hypothetical protein
MARFRSRVALFGVRLIDSLEVALVLAEREARSHTVKWAVMAEHS